MPKKDDHGNKENTSHSSTNDLSRRDFLKGSVTAAGAGLAAAAASGLAAAESQLHSTTQAPSTKNPYGARPGGGISLPDYYRPWASIKNRNFYRPWAEPLPKHEMRISFLGSTPWR
jgi:ribonuclease Z